MSNELRELTGEEIREEFLQKIRDLVEECNDSEGDTKDKLSSLAFEILCLLDGSRFDMPQFIVAPWTGEESKKISIEEGKNYYPNNDNAQVKGNISGFLHDLFYE